MGAGPYFDSGGFKRDQQNSIAVHLVGTDGAPYNAGGGAGSSVVDAQLKFIDGVTWTSAPGTAARGLLVDSISGAADASIGLPARVGVVGGYDGTNVRAVKTSAAGVVQVDVLSMPASGGGLTDAQLRASPVPVDSEITTADLDTGVGTDTRAVIGLLRAESGGASLVGSANPLPVSGPLTDTQLRATAVPVSGTFWQATQPVSGTFWQATQPVSGPLTDTQLRASAVPVDSELTTADLDTGAGTDTRGVVGLVRAESGGGLLVGSANPLPVTTGVVQVGDNGGSLTVDGSVSVSNLPAVQPVSDNAGSLTVDAPVATPVFARLSDGTAALVGQKAMAASLPVVVASDQSVLSVGGNVAAAAADSGNPVKIGARAISADITALTANNRADALATLLGKHLVLPYALPGAATQGTVNLTTSTAADVIAAPAAGVRLYITSVVITNAHASTGTKVEIRDGTTVRAIVFAGTLGGGAVIPMAVPLRLTAATALTARCVTTGADVDVSATGYTAAE